MKERLRRLVPLEQVAGRADVAGAKAARLAAARRAGFPVLPGWVVPLPEARPALRAGAAAVRGGRPAAARRAVLSHPLDPVVAAELATAVDGLGGRVVVRSSSPLERDPRWSGAFSSMAEVTPGDAVAAARSCWAAAFAVDPLARLEAAGMPPEALELALLIQPEIHTTAGGLARVVTPAAAVPGAGPLPGPEVVVEGVAGHPGALLSGWDPGASARVRPGATTPPPGTGDELASLIGRDTIMAAARLAVGVHAALGDDTIEWATGQDGRIWLLQSMTAGPAPPVPAGARAAGHTGLTASAGTDAAAAREFMPLLAAQVRARGRRIRGRPAATGTAAGRLVPCRPHERPDAGCLDAILLVDRALPALAPLLFGARGVIARAGGAGSHLAEVARSLAVPMVTGAHPETVTGTREPGAGWLAAIDGCTGDVALLPE